MLHVEEQKLKKIKTSVYELGVSVIEANELSHNALVNNNLDELKNIILSSKMLLLKSNEIDNLIVATLALYSPEAKDLRNLVAYLKITNEIVRAGTNSRAFLKSFVSSLPSIIEHQSVLEYAIKLQKSALEALRVSVSMINLKDDEEIENAFRTVSIEESKTDDLYGMIEKDIIKTISKDIELPGQCFTTLSSLRRLEKVADRSLSIAYLLIFAKNGGELHSNN